jgi:hypothetical protein
MKMIAIVLIFCAAGINYVVAQSFTGTLSVDVSKIEFSPQVPKLNTIGIEFTFNRLIGMDSKNTFSLFNKTTGLNDIFVGSDKDNFRYRRSEVLLANRVFNPFNNRIDSFNPNGSKDFGNAVVSGILSLLFD